MRLEYSQRFQNLTKLWKDAEIKKDRKAEYKLALLYLSAGKDAEGAALLRRSAKQRYTDAMFALGVCYETGRGVRRDNKAAIKWYKRSADNLSYDLMTNPDPEEDEARKLVRFLMQDEDLFGLFKDERTDEEKLEDDITGAEEGDAEAQRRLGVRYYDGFEVKKDRERAIELFKKSAAQGNEGATHCLASHFESEKKYKIAVKYYKKYAEMQIEYRHRRLGW